MSTTIITPKRGLVARATTAIAAGLNPGFARKRRTSHQPTKALVGVGGCGGCTPTPTPRCIDNSCYEEYAKKQGCRLLTLSHTEYALTADTAFSFVIEPRRTAYFLPTHMALKANVTGGSLTRAPVRITSMSINDIPQLAFNTPVPTATTEDGFQVELYEPKSGAGSSEDVPGWVVAIGPIGKVSASSALTIGGFNLDGVNAIDLEVTFFGYPSGELPNSMRCGHHPSSTPNS